MAPGVKNETNEEKRRPSPGLSLGRERGEENQPFALFATFTIAAM